MLNNDKHLEQLNAPVQRIKARVELYLGSTLTSICNCGETLRDFTIERTGENKFFGFGICQKISGTLIDLYKQIDISKDHHVEGAFGVDNDFIYPFPKFHIQEFKRDEVAGTVTFTGYDPLFKAENYTYADLTLDDYYTVRALTAACANVLQLPLKFINIDETLLDTAFRKGTNANFTGEESVRRVLDTIAEFTQSVYYINSKWELVFRQINPAEELALTIDGGQYISLDNGGSRRLKNIMSVTEGEDNVHSVGEGEGVTQFVRDNPLYTLRTDLDVLLGKAQEKIGGVEFEQFAMEWSGNYLLEIGDRIAIETEDSTVYGYLLDDAVSFDGGLYQVTGWQFDENEGERASNPITLGQALNQTYIRVDKANKRIDMLVSDVSSNSEKIAQISISTEGIFEEVSRVEKIAKDSAENVADDVETLTKKVETAVTADEISYYFKTEIDKGVEKVETSTGYKFDETGLTVSKSGSEMTTQITENGMTIKRDEIEVLKADNTGVIAKDLHATTYLMVGGRSRFENYESNRTGCFWIGGMN